MTDMNDSRERFEHLLIGYVHDTYGLQIGYPELRSHIDAIKGRFGIRDTTIKTPEFVSLMTFLAEAQNGIGSVPGDPWGPAKMAGW